MQVPRVEGDRAGFVGHHIAGVVLLVVGIAATCGSVGLNVHFYATRTASVVDFTVAAVMAGACDILKVIAAGFLPLAYHEGRRGWVALLSFFVVLGVTASGIAAIGFYSDNRARTVGVDAAKGSLFASGVAALEADRSARSVIAEIASSGELAAQIVMLLGKIPGRQRDGREGCVIGALAPECTEIQVLATRKARAIERERLDVRIAAAITTLGGTAHEAAGLRGDAQVRTISTLAGVSSDVVELLLAVLFAILVESTSAGSVAASGWLLERRTPAPVAIENEVVRGGTLIAYEPLPDDPTKILAAFFEERVAVGAQEKVGALDLQLELEGWCARRSAMAPAWAQLNMQLTEYGVMKVTQSGKLTLLGVGLRPVK